MNKEIKYAGFWTRLKASIVDYYIISIITVIIAAVVMKILFLPINSLLLDEITYLSTSRVGFNVFFTPDILSFGLEVSSKPRSDETVQKLLLFNYIANVLYLVILSGYFTCMAAMKRQSTYGLHIFDAVIVDRNMHRLSSLHSFIRSIATIFVIFCTLGLGFVIMAFRKDKRGLHDIIVGTYVIYDKRAVYVEKKTQVNSDVTSKEPLTKVSYSRLWTRAPAFLVDAIIGGIFLVSIQLTVEAITPFHYFSLHPIPLSIFFALYTIPQLCSIHQATFGMRTLGIIIVDENLQKLSFKTACLRYIVVAMMFNTQYGLWGLITILFRKDKKCLQDMITKTYVIDEEYLNQSH